MGLLDRLVPEEITRFDPFNDGDHIHGDVRASQPFYEDAFGNLVSRQTRNDLDLAAHYAFTPQRLRLYRNGSRQVIHYDVSASSDIEEKRAGEEDVFVLTPSAGDTVTLKTAERLRYTVNFVSEFTQALAINQSLTNTNDRLLAGLDTSPNGDQSDGYFLEQTASHADDAVDMFSKRNGSVLGSKATVSLREATQVFQRFENDYNWYNVGESNWGETVTDAVKGQLNVPLTTTSTQPGDSNAGPGGRGPISGNGRVFVQVQADASTTGLEAYAGSSSFTTLGSAGASLKAPGAETPALTVSQTTAWEPLGIAFRVDPDRPNVAAQFRSIGITQGTGQVMIIACDPSNVLNGSDATLSDSDFTTTDRPEGRPFQHSGQNSVLQRSDTGVVAKFPDKTGSPVTTATNPGGYQLAYQSSRQSGSRNSPQRSAGTNEKHGILDGDLAVPIAKPNDSSTDMRFVHLVEMDE